MNKRFNATYSWTAGIFLFTLIACSSGKQKDQAEKNTDIIQVTVAKAMVDDTHSLNLSGLIEAAHSAGISTSLMGHITSIRVKPGDRVVKGQLLATISNEDLQAKKATAEAMIHESEAALKNAQKDLDRFTILYNQQSASAKELENITLQYNAAKSRAEQSREMRNQINAMFPYANLTAPFSGIITQKTTDAGSITNPGMPILTIEQDGSFQVSATVPENSISHIHRGTAADVFVEAAGKTIKGIVSQINQSAQFSGGQYIIKISIPENQMQGLYSGMYARISIPDQEQFNTAHDHEDIWIPLSAILQKDELNGIFTIGSNNTAILRWVRLGKTMGNRVEVLSGLDKTESLIIHADGQLYNGVPVKIRN